MSQETLTFPPTSRAAYAAPDPLPERLLPGVLGVDVEHKGLGRDAQAVGLVVAETGGDEYYLPFGHAEGRQHDPARVRAWAEEHLAGRRVAFRAAKNDIEVLRRWGLDLEVLGVLPSEVQHAAALLDDHRRTFTLEALAQDRLGEGKLKLPYDVKTLWQRPPEECAAYARRDARLTLNLYHSYRPDVEKEKLTRTLELEDDLIYSTLAMERAGAILDLPKLERWDREVAAASAERTVELHRRTGLRVNPNSRPEMIKLFRHLGLEDTGVRTDGGQEAFPDEVLEGFAGRWVGVGRARRFEVTCEEVQLAREVRQLESLRSKYTGKYLAGHLGGVLYYQLHQLRADEGGTITGRYASSGIEVGGVPRGANIQQVKKPDKQEPVTLPWIIRELFLPRRGRAWFHADASQIEFRLMAHYSRSRKLIEAYRTNPDQDFHQLVTDEILGGIMSRTLAKNFNFMKVYGGGVGKVMLMTGLEEDEARRMDRHYRREFPEAERLLNRATRAAERRGFVHTFIGRRRRYHPGDRYYSALNAVLQGTAADIMKYKILRLYRERKLLELLLFFTVHDEVNGDVPPSPKVLKRLEEVMAIQELPLDVPITWDCATGANWKEAS